MNRAPWVVAAVSLFLVLALATPAFAWQFGLVDSNDRDSQGTSLAIDKAGTVYVALGGEPRRRSLVGELDGIGLVEEAGGRH